MKTNPKDILTRVDGLFAEVKQLQKENESLLEIKQYRSWKLN